MRRRRRPLPTPLGAPVRWLRRLFDPHTRAVAEAQRRHPGELLQPAGTTGEDRHPALFAELARLLGGHPAPRLLSFGCSSGEEVLTLARYLLNASIDGIDLNARAIAKAKVKAERAGLERVTFTETGTPPQDRYDAVLCLSVLRHGGLDLRLPDSCASILPFAQVDAMLGRLDAVLEPGGLLAIWGSNFAFAEMAIAPRYEPLAVPGMRSERAAVYGADDRRQVGVRNDRFLYRKRG